jgi:SAM-dependent methyltransferase
MPANPIDYATLDAAFLPLDRAEIKRSRNITRIPVLGGRKRRRGRASYAEWAHVIGIFQTLIGVTLRSPEPNTILDVGCGTGILAIACEPYLGSGRYIGIDVSPEDLAFCRSHYPPPLFEFHHADAANAFYAPDQPTALVRWPVDDGSCDLITAPSVWTHFTERDARGYLHELRRVLKPDGRAIVTCFLRDETYARTLPTRTGEARFHRGAADKWVFEAHVSDGWYTTDWAETPERAMAMTPAALESATCAAGLRIDQVHQGHWKNVPGLYIHDIVILSAR